MSLYAFAQTASAVQRRDGDDGSRAKENGRGGRGKKSLGKTSTAAVA